MAEEAIDFVMKVFVGAIKRSNVSSQYKILPEKKKDDKTTTQVKTSTKKANVIVKFRCPKCKTALDNQHGFDRHNKTFTCKNCGTKLCHSYSGDEFRIGS